MILDEAEAVERLNSEHNLANRLAQARLQKNNSKISKDSMEIFGIPSSRPGDQSPVLPPSADELIQDVEAKLKLGLAHDAAVDVMYDSVDLLRRNLVNMDPSHPERLAKVAFEMSRIVHTIDEVRSGNKHLNAPTIIYKPVMLNEINYETVLVHE
jgi:hypothetical protein